jgi:Leucine-rich repeat (LRR) protein
MQYAASHVDTLRVMHCTQLTEMRGLNLYPNLKELNVSSNNVLSMSGLESLRCLVTLNLSCNKITQIFNLQCMAKTLKSLNLSHNRIVSLVPLGEFAEVAVLETLDLTDNYIGDLSHVRHLGNYAHLRTLAF